VRGVKTGCCLQPTCPVPPARIHRARCQDWFSGLRQNSNGSSANSPCAVSRHDFRRFLQLDAASSANSPCAVSRRVQVAATVTTDASSANSPCAVSRLGQKVVDAMSHLQREFTVRGVKTLKVSTKGTPTAPARIHRARCQDSAKAARVLATAVSSANSPCAVSRPFVVRPEPNTTTPARIHRARCQDSWPVPTVASASPARIHRARCQDPKEAIIII